MGFINKVRQAKIDIQYQSGQPDQLIVSSPDVDWATHYACYLQVNGETVVTYGYRHQREFHFDLAPYSINDQIKVRYYFYNKAEEVRGGKSVDVTAERLRLWILTAEEDKLSNLKLSQLGKLLVEQRQLQLGPFPQYSITADFNFWEQDPFNNRSWQWRLHWFEFINQLLPYYHQSKEQSALALAQKSIESWWDSYWGKPSQFEFIRHDHATALRAEVLLTYYCYVAEYVPDYFLSQKLFFKKLHQFLLELKAQLLDPGFYSEHTNHGLEQARVLLLLGVYFQDQKAQKIAVERISSELEFSFTEEGVHKENSPGYHQFVLKVFLNIIARFPKEILGDLATRFDEIGTKALNFLTHIIRPDGYLPIIGDTESIRPSDGYKTYFKDDVAYQEYLYSASLGKRGQKPSETFKVYEESGYAIYRNHWGDRNDFTQSVQLILKAGCLSQYHHQQDEGNVLLYAYGEDWLIDSGLYNYINADPIRKYMRSRHAHNVPIISNTLYHTDFTHRLHNWKLTTFVDNDQERYSIKAVNKVLVGIKHQRVVSIYKKQIEICDLIETASSDKSDKIDEIKLNWHLPRDKEVNILNHNEVEVISQRSGVKLVIKLGEGVKNISLLKGTSPDKQSVYSLVSKKFGKYEESFLLQVTYRPDIDVHSTSSTGSSALMTNITFEFYKRDSLEREIINNKVNDKANHTVNNKRAGERELINPRYKKDSHHSLQLSAPLNIQQKERENSNASKVEGMLANSINSFKSLFKRPIDFFGGFRNESLQDPPHEDLYQACKAENKVDESIERSALITKELAREAARESVKEVKAKSKLDKKDNERKTDREEEHYRYEVRHYGFPLFHFTLPVDWRVNPYSNKNWQHHFMSLRWINGESLGKENLIKLLTHFYNFHVRKEVKNPYYNFLRGDHTASIRLRKLIDLYCQFEDSENLPLLGILSRLIRADIDNLQKPEIYRKGHNHALMVDNALLYLLAHEKMQPFYRLVNLDLIVARSLETVRQIYYPDGFTRENSISYQEYNLGVIWEYANLIKSLEIKVDFNIENIITESKKVLGLSLTTSDLYFPIGDSYYQPKPLILRTVFGDGDDNRNVKSLLAPYSNDDYIGFYFNKGLVLYKYQEKVHFGQTIMYGSNSHKQNDELSYCLSISGTPFVIDPGYSTICPISMHDYIKSEFSHSTLLVGSQAYDAKDHTAKILDDFISYQNDQLDYCLSHRRYHSYKILNTVSINKERLVMSYRVIPCDILVAPIEQYPMRLSIVLHPDVTITQSEGDVTLVSEEKSIELFIDCNEKFTVEIESGKMIDQKEQIIETNIIRVYFYDESIQISYRY